MFRTIYLLAYRAPVCAVKIAWLIQGDEQYGIRSGSRALMMALTRVGIDCPVIALEDGEFTEECVSIGLDVTQLRVGDLPRLRGGLARKFAQFTSLLRKELVVQQAVGKALQALNADALHFRRPNLVQIGGRAARDNKLRSFWHMPNAISARYPFGINRRIYQTRCSRLGVVPIANSKYTAGTLGNHPVKPYVMYLAVDQERFDLSKITPLSREAFGIGSNAIVCGIVGRVAPNKGQDRIISAVDELVNDGHDLHLLIIGGPTSGQYYEHLVDLRQHLKCNERIHLVGPVSDTERYYGMMDFSINSRIDPEPCGISVLESMMCSTPVLVHASGGPAETVIDGITGWHYPSTSGADTRAGLLRAIRERDNWPTIGKAARQHAIDSYSLDAQVRQYLQIVQDVIGLPPHQHSTFLAMDR